MPECAHRRPTAMVNAERVLDALGDPTRRRIFMRLRSRTCSSGELARGMRVTVHDPRGRPVELVGTPFHIAPSPLAPEGRGIGGEGAAMPPQLGEHTDAVLHAAGYGSDDIARLRAIGAI